jgi:multidrug resistance efflux pump
MSPHVAGYVTELDVGDKEFVHKGQVLRRIQSADYEAARDRARGALGVARGQLDAGYAELALAKVIYPAKLDAASAALAVQRANRGARHRCVSQLEALWACRRHPAWTGGKFTAFTPENATGNFVKIVQRVPVKIDIDSGLDLGSRTR